MLIHQRRHSSFLVGVYGLIIGEALRTNQAGQIGVNLAESNIDMEAHQPSQSNTSEPAILVIEDNQDEWLLIRWTLLQQFPQMEIVWARTPLEVTLYLRKCLNEPKAMPCFILLDLYLPTAKLGLGVMKALRTHHLFQHIPLITISRSSHKDDIADAFSHLSDYYLVKPGNYADWQETFRPLKKYVPDQYATRDL